MSGSLSGRLLAGVFILLILFFGITVVALDTVFHRLSDQAMHNRLEGQLIALIAASDPDAAGLVHPDAPLAEPRFETPGSGLFGTIEDASGRIIWRSRSAVAMGAVTSVHSLHTDGTPGDGQRRFDRIEDAGVEWERVRLNVDWEMSRGRQQRFTFTVAENLSPYRAQLRSFRVQLLGWFGVLTLLLLIAVSILMRRALRPLRRLESEIGAIEHGERAALSEGYPRELAGVSKNLNTLLGSERKRAERYRQTLGNLAHELKTPLAIIRTQPGHDNTLIERMDQIIAHQLRRARISAGSTLGRPPLDLADTIGELVATLNKVHAGKDIAVTVDGTAPISCDRGDMLELFGNLLDNAYKWARHRVRVDIGIADGTAVPGVSPRTASIVIEDDGPGWGAADPGELFARGVRADESRPGHGLGLSIVQDLVEAYGGSIHAGVADGGGARVEVRLPAPREASVGAR